MEYHLEIQTMVESIHLTLELVQNRILIWDNIKKRGFMGPLIWHLCHHSHHSDHSSHQASFKKHLLKLDVKFALPMFNGAANPENLDNWIR